MGHYGDLNVRMDQESALSDRFRAVAKKRGTARTVLTHAARSDSKGNGEVEKVVQSIEETVSTFSLTLSNAAAKNCLYRPASAAEPALQRQDGGCAWLLQRQ